MRKSLAVFVALMLAMSSATVLAQARRRIPKAPPEKSSSKSKKPAAEPEQELIPSPFTGMPKPPPEDSEKMCPLAFDGIEMVGLKLGTNKQEVLGRARMAHKEAVDGWRLEPYIEYYAVYGDHAKNPLPDIGELESIIDKNNEEALGGSSRRKMPSFGDLGASGQMKRSKNNLPLLKVYDEATETKVTEVKFGFYADRLFHIRANYFSTKTQWGWEDIRSFFASSGIQPSHWVRHTNVPINPLYQRTMEVMGRKIYKQTAYCKGFYLTVQYSNEPTGFTLDLIHYPALVGGYQQYEAAKGTAKGNFKP